MQQKDISMFSQLSERSKFIQIYISNNEFVDTVTFVLILFISAVYIIKNSSRINNL